MIFLLYEIHVFANRHPGAKTEAIVKGFKVNICLSQ
jgi:hypothetical protein